MYKGYIPYRQIVDELPVEKGEMIWLTGDLVQLALRSRKNGETFDPDAFINSFIQKLTPDGTLLIPAFNFTLSRKAEYDVLRTKPVTGALAETAWKHPEFQRTWHPLHSFMVWGKYQQQLVGLRNSSSFEPGSPFGFLWEKHAKMVMAGTGIAQSFSFVHYLEEKEKVRYRRMIEYQVRYTDDSGKCEELRFHMYAKKPGWTMCLDRLEQKLSDHNLLIRKTINDVSFTTVDLRESASFIEEDIRINNAKNIARFDRKIFAKEIAKQVIALFGFRTLTQKIKDDQYINR